jgi:hypothetical protein
MYPQDQASRDKQQQGKDKTMTEKPLDQMTNKELTDVWNKRVSKLLVGRKIIKVEYISEEDANEQGWDSRPVQIQLDNGVWLTPTSDDEGNNGGAIHTNLKNNSIIVLRKGPQMYYINERKNYESTRTNQYSTKSKPEQTSYFLLR